MGGCSTTAVTTAAPASGVAPPAPDAPGASVAEVDFGSGDTCRAQLAAPNVTTAAKSVAPTRPLEVCLSIEAEVGVLEVGVLEVGFLEAGVLSPMARLLFARSSWRGRMIGPGAPQNVYRRASGSTLFASSNAEP